MSLIVHCSRGFDSPENQLFTSYFTLRIACEHTYLSGNFESSHFYTYLMIRTYLWHSSCDHSNLDEQLFIMELNQRGATRTVSKVAGADKTQS